MTLFTLAFLAGDMFLQIFSQLPDGRIIYAAWVAGIICLGISKMSQRVLHHLHLPAAFLLGFAFTATYANYFLSWSLPSAWQGKTLIATGYIASIPHTQTLGVSCQPVIARLRQQPKQSMLNPGLPRPTKNVGLAMTHKTYQLASSRNQITEFLFAPETLHYENITNMPKGLLHLSCYHCEQNFKAGDKWQLTIRLKHLHGTSNPGGFDHEAWALQKNIRATGYMLPKSHHVFLPTQNKPYMITRWRQLFAEKVIKHLPNTATAPWLMALIIGERNNIPEEDWRVLRNTGTNHLMAIAGLHIGCMAGLVYWIVLQCWRRIPRVPLIRPAQEVAAIAALITALAYSALAGFCIPTQRACVMLFIFLVAVLCRKKLPAWYAWSLALFTMLLINPLDVLSESFWLSFGTIALIIYGMSGRLAPSGFWWKWGRVQWVITLGLIPLSLLLFQECSLISFVANSIAIPWLEFLVLPFALLGAVTLFISTKLGSLILFAANQSLSGLWWVLSYFSQLSFASWHQSMPNYFIFTAAVIGVVLLLLPRGLPGRGIGIFWLLPLFFYQPLQPRLGEMWLTLLDVGQGLSVMVQTQHHVLVYDTGAKSGPNFDMGESVVLPALHALHAKKIDMLVISHGDNDHIGGAQAILEQMPVLAVRTSVVEKVRGLMRPGKVGWVERSETQRSSAMPASLGFAALNPTYNISSQPPITPCLAHTSWQWDGVTFTFLYPPPENFNLGNNSSCILKIDNGQQKILLTGDMEKLAEKYLVKHYSAKQLAATVLVAPHHGSKTSALKKFVTAVHPSYVLYSTGYRNRYHFPHKSVVATYTELGAVQLNTAVTGAMQFKLAKGESVALPSLYRLEHPRYWVK